ncbi:hypothetical protein COCC4DRAFT_34436 [Bipolaris maydis ATCC 48331]|uniref:HhH-GPD domain-containing protein n=2 Tax=Cochliobolus heterostrophus TaxID=5016 RepID=M2UGU4_COCH5|nr:uncharacterized protein COCC4DRAFT_34436 [Bipolaris maydis ATCC 48331]EMD87218.1 hypothetical protein COCHEDRAFT_1197378 [Bipolaris maydis C5]KAJ5022976.1 DNA glycosylase [Bipolaris maydis]ENI00387.1 hypothetical protein COCC4DRAFT_34436 [Bipolaris maydis ATCC 48331]KAJ5056282.1 DNA glycosylase [Bipolaris maydis]KAJ6211838.1 DNA glycosylase [Bipolaris maydis]
MEAGAAMVSFVSLAGTAAQGLKFLYDFATNMKDCPKDIREMRIDLELVEVLITEVVRQCNERDKRLRESAGLARAIGHAQESVEDLNKQLDAYRVDGKRKRIIFATKINQMKKLRTSLDRTKTIMLEFKDQLQSDLLYDLHDMNQEVLKSVEKTSKNLETYDRQCYKVKQEFEVQSETTNNSSDRGESPAQLANDTSSQGLADIKIIAKELEHIKDLLAETKISSSPTSLPSTPALSREVSDISVMSSSQETTASSISSSQTVPRSISQNAQQANITSKYPLLQFKDNQFRFLVATIFIQRTTQHVACQRASECLAVYPTPEALSKASPEALEQYFIGIGLHKAKPPQLIKLAQAYIKDPPQQGRLRSKATCPQSEISHLPHIGPVSINVWLVYCCERVDIVTNDTKLLEYIKHLKRTRRADNCL